MILSLLIISLVFTTYLANQKNQNLENELNHIQQNARNSIDILKNAIHQTGEMNCGKITNNFPVFPFEHYSFNSKNKLSGNDHEFTIRYMDIKRSVFLKKINKDRLILTTDNNVQLHANDILIISDCKQAEIFKVKSIEINSHGQKIFLQNPLHYWFIPYAEIARLKIDHYYIGQTDRKNEKKRTIFALYLKDIYGQKSELVENINDMKLIYSISKDSKIINSSAKNIVDWSHVVGIGIDLTLASQTYVKHWYTYATIH